VTAKSTTRGSWPAVSVVPGKNACEAARKLGEQRFLARNAPRLPLEACNRQDQCQCKYARYADRRGGPRRSEDRFDAKGSTVAGERRRPGERREPR
jgi:hypothetical protein